MERYKAIEIERDIYQLCKTKYPELKPYASYYELKSLYGMLCNLTACNNRRDFKAQELKLRCGILAVFFRCNKWKELKTLYGTEMKEYCLVALLGTQNIKRLVQLKQKVMRRANEDKDWEEK